MTENTTMKTTNLGVNGLVGKYVAKDNFNVNDVLYRIWQWQEFNLTLYQIMEVTYQKEPFMVIQDIS